MVVDLATAGFVVAAASAVAFGVGVVVVEGIAADVAVAS